jgi:uncharacterized protein GlcG (DUF336 family)
MTPSWQLEVKMKEENILRPEIDLSEVNMEYGHLVVFIRQDSAEIWGFRYGLTLGIGTVKMMASTGVFMRVVFALKRFFSTLPSTSSIILT